MKSENNPTGQIQEQDDAWDIDGVAMYRAASFAVALPSFMIGTALFMLGFSMSNETVLYAACMLYSVSFAGFTSRILVGRQPWRTTLPYLLFILVTGTGFYGLLWLLLKLLR